MRNTIEGLNGYAKDPAHEALAQPARRRVRGIAAQSVFTALLLMAANTSQGPRPTLVPARGAAQRCRLGVHCAQVGSW